MLIHIVNNVSSYLVDPISCKRPENMNLLKLYYGDQKSFEGELIRFYKFLSRQEIDRSKRFRKKSDERTYVITHALVNRKISEILNISFKDLNVRYFDKKKPSVEGHPLDFNLSHSSDYFAFAVTNNKKLCIGVDIEVVKNTTDIEQIVKHYFHENEISYILSREIDDLVKRRRFYEVWTRKEAFFKMQGLGITDDISQVDLSPGKKIIEIKGNSKYNEYNLSEVFIYTLRLPENIVLSLSVNSPVDVTPVLSNIF